MEPTTNDCISTNLVTAVSIIARYSIGVTVSQAVSLTLVARVICMIIIDLSWPVIIPTRIDKVLTPFMSAMSGACMHHLEKGVQ